MLAHMQPPNRAPARPFESQVLGVLNAIVVTQNETVSRLVRMETRMVNLMAAHNLNRDGQPARNGGTV